MLRLIVLLYVLVTSVLGETTSVARCTNRDGELPINAYLEGCTTPPCNLPQLQNAIINVIFRAPHTLRSMRTLAMAFLPIGPIFVPIPYDLGSDAVTCNFLTNTYCPVMEGEVVQYTLKLFIQSIFPVGVAPAIEFSVVDENNSPIFCFRTNIRITPPVDTRNSTQAID